MRKRLTDEEVAEVIRLYTQEGLTLQQIADHYGCHESTVWKWLRRKRIKPRKRHQHRPGAGRASASRPAWLDRAIEMYAAGGTLRDVAEVVGVPPSKVLYQFKKAGVPRRSVGRPRMSTVLERLRELWQQATPEERAAFREEVSSRGREYSN